MTIWAGEATSFLSRSRGGRTACTRGCCRLCSSWTRSRRDMLSRHGGDWVERLWFKSKLSEFCQICTNMYKKINCRLIFPFLSNTIQLYSFSVSSWLPFQYWCPLYNIQPPSLPSQIERSPSFAYLHYRDNPLVRRPICASPWLVLFESWNLVEIPFCLKVEITEISKPFICQRLAGESQTAKSFNCSSLKTRKRQRENNYLLKFADIVEISGLRHEWMGMIACDLVCDKCDKCELTNTMMAGGRWNHFPVDCGTRQTRVAAQFIFCCPNATSNGKIQNSWDNTDWRISLEWFILQTTATFPDHTHCPPYDSLTPYVYVTPNSQGNHNDEIRENQKVGLFCPPWPSEGLVYLALVPWENLSYITTSTFRHLYHRHIVLELNDDLEFVMFRPKITVKMMMMMMVTIMVMMVMMMEMMMMMMMVNLAEACQATCIWISSSLIPSPCFLS